MNIKSKFISPNETFEIQANEICGCHKEYLTSISSSSFEKHLKQAQKTLVGKRIIDVSVSIVGLTIFGVLMPLFWIIIKFTSPGPLFIRQERIGRNRRKPNSNRRSQNVTLIISTERRKDDRRTSPHPGKKFMMIKLRTMHVEAEKETGAVWATKDDPRVTPFGKWLRHYHLDELPQLWNVLKGEMSLVGPRPERTEFVMKLNQCLPGYSRRLEVPPGITGLAQVRNGYDTSINDVVKKLRYDLVYIRKISVGLDMVILFASVGTVIKGKKPTRKRYRIPKRVPRRQPKSVPLRRENAFVSGLRDSLEFRKPARLSAPQIVNALSIDVEDYYQVASFESIIKQKDWEQFESRVEQNTDRILAILDEYNVKATFFVLGWIAERHPDLVRRIAQKGHEIASHGYVHKPIYDMSPKEFRADLRKTKQILESITGEPVRGYRAPNCSIVKKTIWAQEILIEEGFSYDSSIFPIHHDRYGIPDADRFFHIVQNGQPNGLIEFPMSTVRLFNQNFPVAGGGYLRFFPISFIKWGIKQVNLKERQPVVLFLHPWEIDPEQPKQPAPFLSRMRHYHNLKYTEQRLQELLSSFQFAPIKDVITKWESTMERKKFHPIIPDESEFEIAAHDNNRN